MLGVDPTRRPPFWRVLLVNHEAALALSGLLAPCESYYTPKGTDTDYIKKHRCTAFRRNAEDQIYMRRDEPGNWG